MNIRPTRPPLRVAAFAVVLALAGGTTLTGCTQMIDTFNALSGSAGPAARPGSVVTPQPNPSATVAFESAFTSDGSVSLTSPVAEELELVLDVWAVESKRTAEWTVDAPKTFGFAVNVVDHRVADKAVLAEKRRVFISDISIRSQTAQSSGQTSSPFQFSADPRTLVPQDTIRSERGLLLNSFQGGLLVPETTIHQLPGDTYGVTLEFSMSVWVEGAPNTDTSFSQQSVYQYLPIAIYPGGSAG